MVHFVGQEGGGDRLSGEKKPIAFEDSDDDDSFLKDITREFPLVPAPRARLGGLDGNRYEVLELIGGGGMGWVFRALDHELGRTVALKFLHTPGPKRVLLVREESQAIARLDHENIIRIHDVSIWNTRLRGTNDSRQSGVPFLVMEYLEGESLQALLRRGPPELRRTFDIMIDVAAGLAHAHARGLVHRDLKPGNVFILSNGRAKLLDFGLARLMAGLATAPGSACSGTPAYMSPEQWRGKPLDARTDVWAAGLLLFEMLTGESPFQEADLQRLCARITSDEPMPSVRERRPGLPEEVGQLVDSAMAKEPGERPPSGAELHEKLRELRERLALRSWRPRVSVAERRQVTLVSCWLTTDCAGHVDTEDYNELEAAFHRVSTAIIHQHGGTPTTRIGTQVLACFGYPVTREDDSEHAVRAALHLKEVLPRELSSLWPRGLAVRVGVHTDMVDLADTTPGFHGMAPAMQGDAPGLTAWLASQAEPNTVLLSDRTYALVRSHFLAHSLGQRVFSRPLGLLDVGVLHVLQERKNVSRFDRALVVGALTPLVERERELHQLIELWNEAMGGRGMFVLLRGEAGIGKSRLIQELHDRRPFEAITWARCQCWLHFKSTAFYPLTDWLQRFLEFCPEDSPQQKQRKLLERLTVLDLPLEHEPPLSLVLSLPIPEDSPFRQLSSERQREKALGSLSIFFQRLAAERPLVFVVEDLHWADPSTLQFLGFLLDRIESVRGCVLLTTRPEFMPSWRRHSGLHVLDIGPLSPQSTLDMIRHVARGKVLPAETLEQLVARTDGIPLFIEEITRMVLEPGGLNGDSPGKQLSTIPATLNELLLARLDQLLPQRKALAQLAATLGREFSYEMLRAIALLREDELQHELCRLEHSGLLFRQGEPPDMSYAFKHALIQNAAYQSLPRSTRQQYHARIARVLAEQFPRVEEEHPELLAQHSARAGLIPQAVDLWQRAGRRAGARSALIEAVSHFTKALEQLSLLPASRERNQREITLCVELGQALISIKGQSAKEVEDVYARALSLCEEEDDVPMPVLSGLWASALVRGDREGSDQIAVRLGRLVEASNDPVTLMVAHFELSARAFWRGEYVVCRQLGLRVKALDHEHRLRTRLGQIRGGSQGHALESLLYAYLYLARSEMMLARAEHARECYSEAVAFAEATHHPYAISSALMIGGAIAYEAEELEVARDVSDRAVSIATENGFPLMLSVSDCISGWAAARHGEVQVGIARIQEGLNLIRSIGAMLTYPYYVRCLAEAYLLSGQLAEGLAAVDSGLELTETNLDRCAIPELRRLQGELLLLQGDEEGAQAAFRQALAVDRDFGATLHGLRAALSLARLMRRADEPRAAHSLLAEACGRFTEGFDLEAYQSARRMMAEFSSHV
jgi:serine/threonine protein kinase/predicted ATPase